MNHASSRAACCRRLLSWVGSFCHWIARRANFVEGQAYSPVASLLAMTVLTSSVCVRRNLDQAPVGIPAIDRTQRTARALLGHRAFRDRDAVRLEMRDHLFRRARCQEAEIVTPCGFMV